MAEIHSPPRVTKRKQSTQLSYELPNRIHTARTYPILSPNGSSIIIYGQENGVRIVWRGGRSFKPPREQSTAPKGKPNGTHDAIVLLDSDDEDSAPPKFEDKPEFGDEEEVFDPATPYPAVLQTLDLYFGTDVLHLAVLPASVLRAEGVSWRSIEPIKKNIVFTAACADNSIRLVTLPLTPPSPLSKARPQLRTDFTAAHAGKGNWGETVTTLGGHHKHSEGVSMTAEFLQSSSSKTESGKTEAHLIIASHTREVTGLIYLYRQYVKSPKSNLQPFQRIHLSSPARRIAFNPSLTPQRSSHLLVADCTGSCRIYDYKTLIKNTISDDEAPSVEQGTWLLSLYPGFQVDASNGAHAGFGRKTIIDAKWVADGGAIIVLLHDGEWAIWDIEGVGPGASQGLLGRQGIKSGSRSNYSISGWIESGLKSTVSQSSGIVQNSKFVPMTPGTRRTTDIFHHKNAHGGPVRGEISVIELASTSPTSPAEETIVFWYGESFISIPNLSKYWAAHNRKGSGGSGSLFNNNAAGRMIKLDGIDLRGERCTGIEQIARLGSVSSQPTEVVILGEHRFTIWYSGKSTSQQIVLRPAVDEMEVDSDGELDMIGIDQALSRMEKGNGANPPKRKMISR
ncbi:hypothetical protein PVAG01_03187 [Phlyctema vagabunda]|uniref:Uncharacterized protein n=1 Tax=Phlyctema vagabunda TaxID=108571 RepID=A0ABR4PU49_9HELO